jgi:HlyD family secretion protein
MKKVNKIMVSAVFLMAVILLVVLFSGCNLNEAEQQIQATGTVEMTETTISSKVNGRVVKLAATEGQEVKQGVLLAELDHEELDAQIGASRSALDVAIANYNSAKTDLQRYKQLYQSNLIPRAEYDQAVTKAEVTKAQVGQAKSNLDLLEVQRNNVKIFAPNDGVLSEKLIENGELVSSGASLFTLLDYHKPWVKIYLPLQEVSKVKLNQKAYVKLDAFPRKKFYGRVSFISKEAEFTPKDFLSKEERVKQVFAVKIELKNKESLLKAGLPVDVWLEE